MKARVSSPRRQRATRPKGAPKRINLALQGGGSHGAFAWGMLDRLLADRRLDIEGISGSSAGSVNAVVLAYGWHAGRAEGARRALEGFWREVSLMGSAYDPVQLLPWAARLPGAAEGRALNSEALTALTRTFSPYQFNPLNLNPLRELLERHVDFASLRDCRSTKLFLSATNVHTGKVKVFSTPEVTVEAVLASACLPQYFQAVEIAGESYWDGGYMGNPVLFPLFYETESRDVLILHVNPIERKDVPRLPHEIENRVSEIVFNSSLLKELRAVAFVQKLISDGWIKEEFRPRLKNVLIHSIRADRALADLTGASKMRVDWPFLQDLFERGHREAARWLARNFEDLGRRSTVDVRREFL